MSIRFNQAACLLLLGSNALLTIAIAQECRDSPGWHMSIDDEFDCQWFSEPFGDDDFYYYDDDIDDADSRCTWFGADGEFRGQTATQACCVCGGGYIEPNVPSFSPAFTMEPTETPCYDVPGWHSADKDIFTCEWYGNPVGDDDDYYGEGDTRCAMFGKDAPNFGYTADQACCVCGGGYLEPIVPSVSPTISSAPTDSPRPTLAPTVTSTVVCENFPGWMDAEETKCPWYTQPVREEDDEYYDENATRCEMFGNKNANKQKQTANDACCACGGGTITKIVVPTASPTKNPIASPSASPTKSLTASPSSGPIASPSASPTESPTASPSSGPTASPSASPTESPTASPSSGPISATSENPSIAASHVPTSSPSASASDNPSHAPTNSPSLAPSKEMSTTAMPISNSPSSATPIANASSSSPSKLSSVGPTHAPFNNPSVRPSDASSDLPSNAPSDSPTIAKFSGTPTVIVIPESPTMAPVAAVITKSPSFQPSLTPTKLAYSTVSPSSAVAAVSSVPTLKPSITVATTSSPSAAILDTRQFVMSFTNMDCMVPLDLPQKLVIANMTAGFLVGGSNYAPFTIESLEVANVTGCEQLGSRRSVRHLQVTSFDAMDLTMALQAEMIENNGADDWKGHIESRFNDPDAVNQFISDVTSNEELGSFSMVQGLDVEVLVAAEADVPSSSPIMTSSAPIISNTGGGDAVPSGAPVTAAPTVNTGNFVTGAPITANDVSADAGSNMAGVSSMNVMVSFYLGALFVIV